METAAKTWSRKKSTVLFVFYGNLLDSKSQVHAAICTPLRSRLCNDTEKETAVNLQGNGGVGSESISALHMISQLQRLQMSNSQN